MKDEIKEILDKLSKEKNYIQHSYCRLFNYEANTLLDYITNLQEENKRLQKRNKILSQDITKDIIKCDVIQTVCGIPIEEIPELKLYKSRNEKAIEYIKRYESIRAYYEYQDGEYWEFNYDDDFQKELLNILQGEDKDE